MRTIWKPALALVLSCLLIAIIAVGYSLWSTSATAQSAASILKNVGLIGSWAVDCSSPPAPSNNWESYNAQPAGAVEWRTDQGPGYKSNIYVISGAKNLGNNQIAMSVRFNDTTDEEIVVSIIASKKHTISTKLPNGTYLVQNGTVVRSGVTTPTLTHCP
jgi:hypothetical protein